MKLRIVALGHRMPAWVTAGYEEYAQRMPRELALELVELKPEPRDRGKPVAQLLAALPATVTQLLIVPDGELHRLPFAALKPPMPTVC